LLEVAMEAAELPERGREVAAPRRRQDVRDEDEHPDAALARARHVDEVEEVAQRIPAPERRSRAIDLEAEVAHAEERVAVEVAHGEAPVQGESRVSDLG